MSGREWLAHAQALKEGGTRKVVHDCGPGEPLQINHKRAGWSAFCHRCKHTDFVERPAETLAEKLERLARVREAEDAVTDSPALPLPALYEPQAWPLDAAVWLYKAGISNDDIARLRFYWNPRLSRVVMPVYDDAGRCVYWQARTLEPYSVNPRKYLNPAVDKSHLIARYGDGWAIVLTEDLLSAYKTSLAGVAGWALMGTRLNTYTTAQVLSARKPVFVWMDPDAAGQSAAAEIMRTLRAYGVIVRNVVSTKDPKLLSREEITRLVTGSNATAPPEA
ncbi:toprim domain-containing protein [Ralstonia solanacearum]|uniref:toprim domain-containing protein n=2 Tax=Ralstonia solanacearum TaxID=305 RepID=UPI000B19E34C